MIGVGGFADLVVNHLAVMERDERGLVLCECMAGFGPDAVCQLTDAPLVVEPWAEMSDISRSRRVAWLAGLGHGRRAAA